MKTCSACGETKTLDAFYRTSRNTCKACVRARDKAFHAKNPDWERQRAERRRTENPDYGRHHSRNYWRNHPAELLALNTRRRLRGHGHTDVLVEVVEIEAIAAKSNGNCGLCGLPCGGEFEVDHITPLIARGPHTLANLRVVHAVCNLRKGARTEAAFG